MVGEDFEMYMSQIAEIHLKSSTMVGENLEMYKSEMAWNSFKILQRGWRNRQPQWKYKNIHICHKNDNLYRTL